MNCALLRIKSLQLALFQYTTALVEIQLNFDRASNIFVRDKFYEFCGKYGSHLEFFFLVFTTQLSKRWRFIPVFLPVLLSRSGINNKSKTLQTIHLQCQQCTLSYGNNDKAHTPQKKLALWESASEQLWTCLLHLLSALHSQTRTQSNRCRQFKRIVHWMNISTVLLYTWLYKFQENLHSSTKKCVKNFATKKWRGFVCI